MLEDITVLQINIPSENFYNLTNLEKNSTTNTKSLFTLKRKIMIQILKERFDIIHEKQIKFVVQLNKQTSGHSTLELGTQLN